MSVRSKSAWLLVASLAIGAEVQAQDGGSFDAGVVVDAGVEPAADGAIDGDARADAAQSPLDVGTLDADLAGTTTELDAGADSEPRVTVPPDATVPRASERVSLPELNSAWIGSVRDLLFDESDRASVEPAVEPATAEPSETEETVAVRVVGCDARPGVLGLDFPERRISTGGLLALILLALFAVWLLDRVRRPLPEHGFIPRLLGLTLMIARLAAVVMITMVASRLLPIWLRPALLLSIAAVAIAVGSGAVWAVLPDVVGGVILITERRVRAGQWIRGGELEGTVLSVGPRLTTLRADSGSTLTVPNRHLVKAPVLATDRRWHEVDVELHVAEGETAATLRPAIRDAVLCSPFIPADPHLVIARDPEHPERWRVRARLLHARYAARFRGQLHERVEEAIGATEPRPRA